MTVTSVKTNERKKWLTIAAGMLEVVKYTDTGLASNRSSFVLHWPKHKTTWKCGGGWGGDVHLQYRKDAHLANFLPRQQQAL